MHADPRRANAAEVRYTVGTGTPADRLQAQTAWSQATLNRIKAEGTLRNAFGTLANVMGLDASQPLTLDRFCALEHVLVSWQGDSFRGVTDDALAALDLLQPVAKKLGKRATLALFEHADHSFHVPAKSGRKDAEVLAEILDTAARWMLT